MKKVLFLLIIAASLFIIKDLISSIYTLWSKKDLLVVAQRELNKEKSEHVQLKARIVEVKKSDFIEAEARNKLFLIKPGEQVVIVPQALNTPKKTVVVVEKPNWQAWLDLFF